MSGSDTFYENLNRAALDSLKACCAAYDAERAANDALRKQLAGTHGIQWELQERITILELQLAKLQPPTNTDKP
jgi:hypothetical protein